MAIPTEILLEQVECETCFYAMLAATVMVQEKTENQMYWCLRFPPTFIGGDAMNSSNWSYPICNIGCGEHKPKVKPNAKLRGAGGRARRSNAKRNPASP